MGTGLEEGGDRVGQRLARRVVDVGLEEDDGLAFPLARLEACRRRFPEHHLGGVPRLEPRAQHEAAREQHDRGRSGREPAGGRQGEAQHGGTLEQSLGAQRAHGALFQRAVRWALARQRIHRRALRRRQFFVMHGLPPIAIAAGCGPRGARRRADSSTCPPRSAAAG